MTGPKIYYKDQSNMNAVDADRLRRKKIKKKVVFYLWIKISFIHLYGELNY